ncbi:MAG TPA: DEAD/DEAH box helicase family protein, partial [Acidimicrobiales bacterium]|nr:DEAD/DEAH box helicase family protein [Acidimicrobiales bacterium]
MAAAIRLRLWQRRALDALAASERPDFLAVAAPGAGKTTFALAAVVRSLHERPARVVVVAPTAHLKRQWADAAAGVGLVLDPAWAPGVGGLPADVHGLVTTYQQVAIAPNAVAALARNAVVVLDEVHHAGDERSWGDALKLAFSGAASRLSLSGTPFRSDRAAIPFVAYELDLARPDFEYGYGEALRDGGVVRPIHFPRVGGQMEWAAGDGTVQAASFDDPLERTRANQRLRAALSPKGDWLPAVLVAAHHQLAEVRREHPDAGGLVIATDVDHAREVARQLAWRCDVDPV